MKRLMMVMACGLCLFGCAKGQTIDQEALAELQEDDDITYEEWKAEYDERLRKATLEGIKEANETLDSFMEATKPHEACDGISSNDCKNDDNTVEVGLTYSNFKLIGTIDYMTVSSINELLDCKGKLVSESGTHTIYQWEDNNDFKLITVGFDNGIAVSKNQVGL